MYDEVTQSREGLAMSTETTKVLDREPPMPPTEPEDVESGLQSLNLNQLEELVEVALTAEAIPQFANHLP